MVLLDVRGLFVFVMDPLNNSALVAFGSAIKTLSDDGHTMRIGGHLVLFGGPDAHDATQHRDYFTKSTDFDLPTDVPLQSTVYYHHGLNAAIKARPLGRAKLSLDDAGVWMEAELQARDAYEAKIMEMVRRGKLGLSSGTAVHLVEREAKTNSAGDTVHEITRWPLGLDASLTPTPGEPRTMAHAMKTVGEIEAWEDELKEEATPNGDAADSEIKTTDDATRGERLVESPQKLLVAVGDEIERFDNWFEKRAGSRKSDYVMPKDKVDALRDFATGLEAKAVEARAIVAQYESKAEAPAEPPEEEVKADTSSVSEALAAYARREAQLSGVELTF